MLCSGRGDRMMKYVYAGLIIVSLLTGCYTYTLEQAEVEKGQLILQEKQAVETGITQAESAVSDTEKATSETEAVILQEKQKQKEIEDLMGDLTSKESELEEEIDFYKEIAGEDPRVLITVTDPVVKEKVEEIIKNCVTEEEKQQAVFEFVQSQIEYMAEGNPKKWSYPKSFLQFKFDFWQLPRETLEWRAGDCEDYSILLCTMLRMAGVPASDVRVVLGVLQLHCGPTGHAWVEMKTKDGWYVLDATGSAWNYLSKERYYELFSPELWGWFNDKEYHEEGSGETEGMTACQCV